MTTKAKFLALAAAHGIEVEFHAATTHPRTGEVVPYWIALDAPDGLTFDGATHVDHSLRGSDDNPRPHWPTLIDAICKIAETLEPCDDPDCDICNHDH